MILFLSAYPPRACGLASYTHQLIEVLQGHFDSQSLSAEVVALEEEGAEKHLYPDEVRYTLATANLQACQDLAKKINRDAAVSAVCIQHRFGMWGGGCWGDNVLAFVQLLEKPLAVVMHNVLPEPAAELYGLVKGLAQKADLLISTTRYHAELLEHAYGVASDQVRIISPGTPALLPQDKLLLKEKHKFTGRLVITCSGYLRRSKKLEYVLEALDEIRQEYPSVLLLLLGPTHQVAARHEGERYRFQLKDLIFRKRLHKHVCFVNRSLQQEELQEYMALTDVFLHVSKNNVGNLLLAMSSACPVIATPSPLTQELLPKEAGMVVDMENTRQLVAVVQKLLSNEDLRVSKGMQAQLAVRTYYWPNIAMAYQESLAELVPVLVRYRLPAFNTHYLQQLTTEQGLQQLPEAGSEVSYSLSDNARALLATVQLYRYLPSARLLGLMRHYVNVLRLCQQSDGSFYTHLGEQGDVLPQVLEPKKAEEARAQAFWALGMLIYQHDQLPADITNLAQRLFQNALARCGELESLRGISFTIKGLYYYNLEHKSEAISDLIDRLANKLQERYEKVAVKDWAWFEKGLSCANTILPEAMLLAWDATGKGVYKRTAHRAFGFLMNFLFMEDPLPATSRHSVQLGGEARFGFSNDPQDIAETLATLDLFYEHTGEEVYLDRMRTAFSWFLGNNHVRQVIYNTVTGSCCDGMEGRGVKHRQSASSLVSFLLSRLIMEKYSLQQRTASGTVAAERRLNYSQHPAATAPDRPSIPSDKVKISVK